MKDYPRAPNAVLFERWKSNREFRSNAEKLSARTCHHVHVVLGACLGAVPWEASSREMSSCFAPNAIRKPMKPAQQRVGLTTSSKKKAGLSVPMAELVGVSSIRIRFISRCQTAGTCHSGCAGKESPNSEELKSPTTDARSRRAGACVCYFRG